MSDGDRRKGVTYLEALFCILALLGLVSIIYATGRTLGVETGRNEVTAREHYEREKETALQACVNIVGKDAVQCATKAIESAQEKSETRQDLYAQQDAARWGFWAMTIAAGSTLVTALGTVLLYQQIVLTRKAVEDTDKATNAMVRQNEISELSQRPWLKLTIKPEATCQPVMADGKPTSMVVMLSATVKNFGQSPAIFPAMSVVLAWADGAFSREAVESLLYDRLEKTGMGGETIFPGEERPIGDRAWFGFANLHLETGAEIEGLDVDKMVIGVGVFYKGPSGDLTHLTSNMFMCSIPHGQDKSEYLTKPTPLTLLDLGVFSRTA